MVRTLDFRSRDEALRVVVGFSGGPDSTALLAALSALASALRIEPIAAHYDHALDSGSAERAVAAARLAETLGVDFRSQRRSAPLPAGRGIEAAARELRYRYLDEVFQSCSAAALAVAHHRDDQVETVSLRILGGTGITGLAAMSARRDHVLRPLLEVPRQAIEAYVADSGLTPVVDPTNREATALRNRLRHRVLPVLRRRVPDLDDRLLALASTAATATARIERRLESLFDTRLEPPLAHRLPAVPAEPAAAESLRLAEIRQVPSEVLPFLLAALHRRNGAQYPPRATAVSELERQLQRAEEERIGIDCGDGWRWRAESGHLYAERAAVPSAPSTPLFAYTLRVPGVVEIPEIASSLRLRRERTKPWMFRGSPTRAALALPLDEGATVEVRNRRPGDRLQPFGCDYEKRLKEILIDKKVAPDARSRIPLVLHAGRIAWVPGITIDERYRVRDEEIVWTASLQPLDPK